MIDEPFPSSHRNAGDLTHPVAETQMQEDPQFSGESPEGGMNTLRQDAEGSLHFLLHTLKPAVLLVRGWHVQGIPFAFEHLPLYEDLANNAGCSIVSVTRPEAGGEEHLLFATRVPGLTDQQCLDCIHTEPESNP